MPVELLDDLEVAGIRADMETIFGDTSNAEADFWLIERITGYGAVDPVTAAQTQNRDTLYASIRGYFSPIASRRDNLEEIGQAMVFIRQYRLILPYDSTGIQIGDIATCVQSRDSDLVGREFVIRDVYHETNNAARVLTLHDKNE